MFKNSICSLELLLTAREGNKRLSVILFTIGIMASRSLLILVMAWSVCILLECFLVLNENITKTRMHSSKMHTARFSGHHQMSLSERGPQMNKFEQASSNYHQTSLVRQCPSLMSRVGREGEGVSDWVPTSDVQRGTPPDLSEGTPIHNTHDAFDVTCPPCEEIYEWNLLLHSFHLLRFFMQSLTK